MDDKRLLCNSLMARKIIFLVDFIYFANLVHFKCLLGIEHVLEVGTTFTS
uniref:Uncharacterized protein n=1 Tax=Arundo donax TaxID=35708 RepID=A0A0A9ETK9_ARUDO